MAKKKLSDYFNKEMVNQFLKQNKTLEDIHPNDKYIALSYSYNADIVDNIYNVDDYEKFCYQYIGNVSDAPIDGCISELKRLFNVVGADFDINQFFNKLIVNETKANKNEKGEDEEMINVPIVTTSEEVDPEEQKLPTMVQGPVAAQRNLPPSAITTHMIKHSKCGCGNPNCDADHGVRARNTAPAPEQSNSDDVKQLQEKANDLKKIVTFTVSTGKLINTSTVDILLRVLKGQTLRNELVSRGLLINGGEVCGLVETVPPTQYYDPVQFPYSFIIQGINGQPAIIQLGGRPILNNGQYIDIYRII